MLYRKLGKSGIDISVLSFGTMRWISEESCHEAINRGLDAGMNYFDTSTGYVHGMSEKWTGNAIKTRRSEAYVSSKTGYATAPDASAVRNAIESSLTKMGLDYFDLYQVWGLSTDEVLEKALKKGGTLDGIHKAMDEGLVKYGPGFTFHGSPELFKKAIDTGLFISATVSYNLKNRKCEELLEYAASKGVGTLIMNPLAGGVLAMAGDERFSFLAGNGCGGWYGSLRFLLANKNITSCLLGVTSAEEIEKNLKTLENAEELDEKYRQDLISKMDSIELSGAGDCTGCRYCEVCPNQFSPSKLMQALRDYRIYGVRKEDLKNWIYSKYVHDVLPEVQLERCVECGLCQKKCPQKIEIVESIRRTKELLI